MFRLLGDGKVHAGDAQMNRLKEFYPILKIIREEAAKYEYEVQQDQRLIVVTEDGTELLRLPMEKFLEESKYLFDVIKKAEKPAFEIERTEKFMKAVGCMRIKESSNEKANLRAVIFDPGILLTSTFGFKIMCKTRPATLLNAGKNTNIKFRIEGGALSDADIARINGLKSQNGRFAALAEAGCRLTYADMGDNTFKNNLLFIDSSLPALIGQCLALSYTLETADIKAITEAVAKQNPAGYTGTNMDAFYAHKIKRLLVDVALGMTPGKQWNGRYDANGGYLVVKDDGEIVCYHFYHVNEVEDYLYHNTRFERGSRTKHQYGSLFRGDDGEVYIFLNLQIRFKD